MRRRLNAHNNLGVPASAIHLQLNPSLHIVVFFKTYKLQFKVNLQNRTTTHGRRYLFTEMSHFPGTNYSADTSKNSVCGQQVVLSSTPKKQWCLYHVWGDAASLLIIIRIGDILVHIWSPNWRLHFGNLNSLQWSVRWQGSTDHWGGGKADGSGKGIET